MTDAPPRERTRLYLITPPRIDDVAAFSDTIMRALDGGDIACLQLRLKTGDLIDLDATQALAEAVLRPVQDRGVAVIINDSVDLALDLGADGVHLGAADTPISAARATLGIDAIVGATCKASRHLAMEAGEQGADYVAFGSFYPTTTKERATPADPGVLSFWQGAMTLPCVAIGGITVENVATLVRAGADFIAVSSGVWDHPDGPDAAVAAFNVVMEQEAAAWA
ncbi:MAG: thiamine phosphate synthase [Pseudomonadota bacterium]